MQDLRVNLAKSDKKVHKHSHSHSHTHTHNQNQSASPEIKFESN